MKTILNTTRSSTQRWTFIGDLTSGELVNGKDRYKYSDFCASDHPMKEQVFQWMTEKGLLPGPAVDTSVGDLVLQEVPANLTSGPSSDLATIPNLTTGPSLSDIFTFGDSTKSKITGKSDQDRLVSMHFGDLNREKGKGATRKLRKQLRSMGYTRLAGLKAS